MDRLDRILVVDADNLPEPHAVKAARATWAREAAPEGALR